jgi:hypothetical protein
MPIAISTECLMVVADSMAVYRLKDLTIGIGRIRVALKQNDSDPWRPMPTSSSLSNWQLALE